MTASETKITAREAQRLATRERLFEAAIEEFKGSGVGVADVRAIVADAGVAHGTFFFHFPTKEHVLAELGHREEVRLASKLRRFLKTPRDLQATLSKVVKDAEQLERRLGAVLFKELLGLYFSPSRPELDAWAEHPLIVQVTEEFVRAAEEGEIGGPDVDPVNSSIFFFLGLYALFVNYDRSAERSQVIEQYITVLLRGLRAT